MNSHAASNGLLMDYCDGELFKSNQLFREDPRALQIQLYYDEIEVYNPIGSFAKRHKLGMKKFTKNLLTNEQTHKQTNTHPV